MDWPLPFILISAGLSMMIMLLLMRFAPRWQHHNRVIFSAAIIPWGLWFAVFAAEVWAIIHHHLYEPEKGFMASVFIMTFPLAFVATFVNGVAIVGMLKLMKMLARRG